MLPFPAMQIDKSNRFHYTIKIRFRNPQKILIIKKQEYSQSDEPKGCTPVLRDRKCLKSSLFLSVPQSAQYMRNHKGSL